MNKILKTLLITGPLITGVFLWSSADVAHAATVNCNRPNASIQTAVDNADGPTTINIIGTCVEDVNVAKDDITLSGRQGMSPCDQASPGGNGTINGTVTVDGVRATIEFLTITGGGAGVDIINRADAHLTCNDISANEAYGVNVTRSSNAVLRDNTLSGNGTRTGNPFIFFDCGLFVSYASSVRSLGNTYEDNQYCGVDVNRQSAFKSGESLPREVGNPHPADPNDRDVITQKAAAGAVAIEVFNGGLVDLRNADVDGLIEVSALSSFLADADVDIVGNIDAAVGSVVRIKNREQQLGDRQVTFVGTLTCTGNSQTFFSNVNCNQTCTGIIGGDTAANTCVP